MREYLPILIMILVGIGLAGVFTAISILFGPKLSTETKQTPFESGFLTQGTEGQRYDVKFFMTALVFLVFDVEVVFLYPWAVAFNRLGLLAFIEALIFIAILLVALAYAWRKGALEWS